MTPPPPLVVIKKGGVQAICCRELSDERLMEVINLINARPP